MPEKGEAGRAGAGIRSDCLIRFENRASGGIEIKLKSKVESMYGDSIRKEAGSILGQLGIENAGLEIEDSGAIPFLIAARIETAVKRALPECRKEALPLFADHAARAGRRDRLRRSRLYLPGNEPKFFLNAGLHQPDAVILDLEDSVAAAEKDAARLVVRNALRQVNFYGAERMVRINPLPMGLDDLDAIIPQNVHVVLIPKCESAETLLEVERKIAAIQECNGGAKSGEVFLMPIVETALGVVKAYEIASASPRVIALTIGLEDYTADLGCPRTAEGSESLYARSAVVNAARAAGVAPIDSVFSDVGDMERLSANALESKSLGFEGMGCIHPRQVPVVHEAFAPTEDELDRARKIVAAFEEAEAKGSGVVSLGSKMIDPPVVKRALRIVRIAEGR